MSIRFLALLFLVPLSVSAQTTFRGHVLGHSGEALPLAHVQQTTLDGVASLQTVRAAPDGSFALSLPSPGVVALRFLGVGHEAFTTTLAFESAGDTLVADIRLGLPEPVKPSEFAYVTAVVDGVRHDLEASGASALTWDAEASGDSASVAFLGATRHGGVRYVPITSGTYVRDGRSYALRLPVLDGRVRASLDTTLLPKREVVGHIAFADEHSLAARYARIHDAATARDRARRAESYIRLLENVDPGDLPRARARYALELAYDWQGDQQRSIAALDTTNHPLLREALLVSYLDANGEDPGLSARVLREVAPDASAWSIRPEALAESAERLGGEAVYGSLLDSALSSPDPRVVGRILIGRLSAARNEGRTDDARALYGRIVTEAARTKYAAYARQRLAPDLRIATGEVAPPFSLTDGMSTFTDKKLPGRVTLLDFWATWCGPCVAEMETLHAVYERYRDEGFEVISISFDDSPDEVAAFRANRWPMPWAHAFPEDGFDSGVARAFEVGSLPTLVLLSADGEILATDVDLIGDALEETVRRALSESR